MGEIARSKDRAVQRGRLIDSFVQDLKYAGRTLRGAPMFAVVAILTLALGIGANTAIFSVVNGVLLRPLPYPDADRLVRVTERNERFPAMEVAWPNFLDWREQARSLEGVTAYASAPLTLLGPDRAIRGRGAWVSEGFFQVFGVGPMLGRSPLPEEHRPGAAPAAVVSHRFWQDELGGDPDLSRHQISAGRFTLQVMGVMPAGFDFPASTDLWFPLELEIFGSQSRTAHNYSVVGRLADGVDLTAARSELTALTARINSQEAGDFAATGTRMEQL